ncbi:MAG: hypothetical protein M3273_00155 [Actinomycetota bacterium]|nr:hypothetical protein [Actinomycetota bacterium]
MTALALFEARKLALNPLLWAGGALLLTFSWLNAKDYWPVVPEDVRYAFEGVVVLAAFAVLVGAWVGLRDRVNRVEPLIASTPAGQRTLTVPARMAALTGAGMGAYLLVFGSAAAYSLARGGHGRPDVFLALDGGLYVGLAACAGFAIGSLTGSRIVSLLAAPLLPGFNYYLQGKLSGRVVEASWLLPNPTPPPRYGPLGYLPDVLPVHSVYLAGIVVLLVGATWAVSSRRGGGGRPVAAIALAAAGASVFVTAGIWLAEQPSEVYVLGPEPSQWVEMGPGSDSYRDLARLDRQLGAYPDDGSATECATAGGATACVFPEHGGDLARALARDASALVPFSGLDGIPTSVRMVPTSEWTGIKHCDSEGEVLVGSTRWSVEFSRYQSIAQEGFWCALYGPRDRATRAADAVHWWFYLAVGRGLDGNAYLEELRRGGWHPKGEPAARAMGRLSVEEVVARLAPIWDELRRGKVSLDELMSAMS